MTTKELYWKDGNIFQMSTGGYRIVLGDKLIDEHGYIPNAVVNDDLVVTTSTIGEHVINVYPPNEKVCYLKDLINPKEHPIWSKYDIVITLADIREKLGLFESDNLFIIQ